MLPLSSSLSKSLWIHNSFYRQTAFDARFTMLHLHSRMPGAGTMSSVQLLTMQRGNIFPSANVQPRATLAKEC